MRRILAGTVLKTFKFCGIMTEIVRRMAHSSFRKSFSGSLCEPRLPKRDKLFGGSERQIRGLTRFGSSRYAPTKTDVWICRLRARYSISHHSCILILGSQQADTAILYQGGAVRTWHDLPPSYCSWHHLSLLFLHIPPGSPHPGSHRRDMIHLQIQRYALLPQSCSNHPPF